LKRFIGASRPFLTEVGYDSTMKTFRSWKRAVFPILAITLLWIPLRAVAADKVEAPHGDIVWDNYGIPHVFAKNTAGLFYGFGYAQLQSHGDLILHLYAEARGRAAEYWGDKFAASDRYLVANNVFGRAKDW
jgi:acyl-homoserine-lactone acylase